MTAQPQLLLPMNVHDDGEIRLYRITLPFLPPSKNVYDRWPGEWKSSAKGKWKRRIVAECEASLMPKGVTRIGVAATLVFPTNARRDTQNYAQALWHWVPDALVTYGVIKDDTPEHIEIGRNWGISMKVDSRNVAKKYRERTHLAITMLVPKHLQEPTREGAQGE